MKKFSKIIGLIVFLLFTFIASKIDFGSRVFEVKNPSEIFLDINKNLIFDEKEPFVISNIHYINENTNYDKYPILKQLTDDEKFFLEYMAIQEAENLLNHRFVKVLKNDILFNNKSYVSELLTTKYVFDDTLKSQQDLIDNIKSIELDDYVILNLKNRKYHKLNCQAGRKSNKFKIVKLSEIKHNSTACKNCHLPVTVQNTRENKNQKTIFKNEILSKGDIKIFFIDLNKTFKPDNSCSESACQTLLTEIKNAKKTIDFAIYGINNQPKILEALINAHKRGVKIRRVYDYSDKKYYEDNDKLDEIITSYKTDEYYDKTKKSALMHNKYFIFDSEKVYTGSSNISTTDLSGFNSNYTILINSKAIAQKYKEDFEQMYNGNFHESKKPAKVEFIIINENTKVKPLFSPQNNVINTEIIPLINSAQKYIYMPVFFITHKGIKEALINAHKRKVDVKIINDATNAHTNYSIHKDLRKEGIKVKTENYAGKMHSKVIITDDKYSVIGSMNFTRSGNSKNDENTLIIDSPEIAKYMRSTFEYLWNKIPDKYGEFDPRAESKDSIGSCSDGIDNDFDEKIDIMDEGCFIK